MVTQTKEPLRENAQGQQGVKAPSVSLPKGGGAIKGIGEKFAANPVTGTGSMTVPIAVSPGRSGFAPQLSLSYDSGSGNGPFGFGWSLSIPSITRKTDKGLPRYLDDEDSDVFILSGSEDLVPVLGFDGKPLSIPDRKIETETYRVKRYRPRIEGLFARIERWTNTNNPGDVHWRSISKDNILTVYGNKEKSRIADPDDKYRIFSWLISETRDDKGNVILYEYKEEDDIGVFLDQVNERNRIRTANRYLKRIYYGNQKPLIDDSCHRPIFLKDDQLNNAGWMFEVVFDYGEGHFTEKAPDDKGQIFVESRIDLPVDSGWAARKDPFSSYRSGFEVRTSRLCQRVQMYHHIPDLPAGEKGYDGLVRSTDFIYADTLDPASVSNPEYTFLSAVVQSGYKRSGETYLKRSLPPLEFEYSRPVVRHSVEEVDPESLENLPVGLDGVAYQWVDLHGEGIPGILTEQGGAWYYKRNISPISVRPVEFAPVELVAEKVNLSIAGGHAQLMDLAGDGRPDFAVIDGPMAGFYEHDDRESWQPFRSFISCLNLDTRDPNVRFIDLDGDGHADLLITEIDALIWHPSLAEEGFGPARRVLQSLDEEKGPRVVFADGTQSVYLADLSGDGLNDIVRIRNGEVCYWPNLGYCRFGAKVTMDNSPWFDNPDLFDHKRVRLADIDGSGTTDIIYLHRDGVRLYFNQSGNCWSQPSILEVFPRIDDLASIVPVDLLGDGTACLVWSSPLAGDAQRHMRYINLMGERKPHLLIKTVNNLGMESRIDYASSTKFYLRDKYDGKPWITRLPFPVHVVEKVSISDRWCNTTFATTYSYHHGYFDSEEREFRGFGRVEQIDVEDYGTFEKGNSASPYITEDKKLYQPPVKTITWYHTGMFLDRQHILSQFQHEYFPHRFEEQRSEALDPLGGFREHMLPEPELDTEALSPVEWREALRTCKGMTLRQEVYELDVDALQRGEHIPIKLFTVACHNCCIHRLQPNSENRHGVFLAAESEAITYHYELDLKPGAMRPDPRIAHTLNLQHDEYANVLQSVAVVYPRHGKLDDDPGQAEGIADSLPLVHQLQEELHLAYTETRYTDDFGCRPGQEILSWDNLRLRVPCEILNYELTGIRLDGSDDSACPDPGDNRYFTLDKLRCYRLSPVHQNAGDSVTDLAYHEQSDRNKAEKRLTEHLRMLFFDDDETILEKPLPLGQLGRLGLPFETYRLALTDGLLDSVFADDTGRNLLDLPAGASATARQILDDASLGGYLSGQQLEYRFSGADPLRFTHIDTAGQYWIRSGIAGFEPDAVQHFYLPERYTDAFGNVTTLEYDERDLFIRSSKDQLNNRTEVTGYDYRVLAPSELKDLNDNYSSEVFDILGVPVALAVMGKDRTESGDTLSNVRPDLTVKEMSEFLTGPYNPDVPLNWLEAATVRFVYDLGELLENGKITYGHRPASACSIMREQHVHQHQERKPELQVAVEYSDGMGTVLVKKTQAEPVEGGSTLRWIATGKTILNNKGKPVKQYEPYFSESELRFDPAEAASESGVTPVMYYDAVGRLIRTEMPDGTFSRVEFSPWHVSSHDANDTVTESRWYIDRGSPDPKNPMPVDAKKRAAWLAVQHAETPSMTILDSLGRKVVDIAHNRVKHPDGIHDYGGERFKDVKHLTSTRFDTEGKPLWIRDARGNLVMQYIMPHKANNDSGNAMPTGSVPCYDIAGNLLFQHSMDAGDRWMIMDAAGKPMLEWDINQTPKGGDIVRELRIHSTDYDALQRPTARWLRIDDQPPVMVERNEFQDAQPNGRANLNGQLVRHYDASGMVETVCRDFKGNALQVQRRLNNQPRQSVIDWKVDPAALVDDETYIKITEYDALNRMTRQYNWHRDVATDAAGREVPTPGASDRVAVYEPAYNRRGLLVSEWLHVRAGKSTDAQGNAVPKVTGARSQQSIKQISYNEKGQRVSLRLGNDTLTQYEYDESTFRLDQIRTTLPGGSGGFPGHRSNLKDPGIIQQLIYTYDAIGNVTEVEDQAYMPVFFQNAIVEPRSLYEYDALYRLTSAKGRENGALNGAPNHDEGAAVQVAFPIADPRAVRNYTQTYRYDDVGNIEQMRHYAGSGSWTRDYAYAFDDPDQEASNRLWQTWTGGERMQATTFGYDAHGNMLNLANTLSRFDLRWDCRDMIHEMDLGGGGMAYYQYDTGRQRTRKRIERQDGSGYRERIYLGGLEIYREYLGGMLVKRVESIHLVDGDQRLMLVEDVDRFGDNGTESDLLFRYQYGNHLGSSVLELSEQARIISYEEYHPYGTSAYRSMSADIRTEAKRYRYTGKERDDESGLHYFGARYYASWLGRWASTDPAGLIDGPGLYLYARQNPTGFIDRSGKQSDVSPLTSLPITSLKSHKERDEKVYEMQQSMKPKPTELNSYKPPETRTRWERFLRSTSLMIGYAIGFGQNTAKWLAGDEMSAEKLIEEAPQTALVVGAWGAGAFSRFRALGAEMKAIEASAKVAPTSKLYNTLVKMEKQGIPLKGTFVETTVNEVKGSGGAFHNIPKQETRVNMGFLESELAQPESELVKSGMKTPEQVLQHEMGHFGQSTALEVDKQGFTLQAAYYEREARASITAAKNAVNAEDRAVLLEHARMNIKIAKSFAGLK
jgi:RHS repeat-associated protein